MWIVGEDVILEKFTNNNWILLGKVNDEIDRIILSCSIKDKCKINTFVKKELIKLIRKY